MQLVRQKDKKAMKRHRSGVVVLAALLATAVASGCAAETGGRGEGAPGAVSYTHL